MASAIISLSVKALLRRYSAEHIATLAEATDTQIVINKFSTHFKTPRYDRAGNEDPLFQSLLTTLSNKEYTTEMKITRINMIKQKEGDTR